MRVAIADISGEMLTIRDRSSGESGESDDCGGLTGAGLAITLRGWTDRRDTLGHEWPGHVGKGINAAHKQGGELWSR